MGHELCGGQFGCAGRGTVSDAANCPVVGSERRDQLERLRHLQFQSGHDLRSIRRTRLPVVVQLLLLQQEDEADRVLHLPRQQVSGICLWVWIISCCCGHRRRSFLFWMRFVFCLGPVDSRSQWCDGIFISRTGWLFLRGLAPVV